MKHFRLKNFLTVLTIALALSACKKDKVQVDEVGKYENGFFIINEGWFGHGTGTVSFFDYATSKITDSIFTKENPGKTLEPATSSLEFGTVYDGKLYLLTKSGGPLVAADAKTMKETGRIAANAGNDWRYFIGLDKNNGLVSTGSGIYPINLSTMSLGTRISTVNGEVGDMVKAGNYIFVISANDGLDILKASDYTLVKNIPGVVVGFAVTPDGSVWAGGDTKLEKINPTSLEVTDVTVPFTINGSWGAWHPGSITASTRENTVFIANNGPYGGGTTIYKYVDGNAASVANAFITVNENNELYGKGLAYNSTTNLLMVNTVESGYGTHFAANTLLSYHAGTGAKTGSIAFTGYYFPATYAFH
ncbi:DUF5074 domain-containing protein [Mucilaginibacter conchicola]|uniref:DUF5074 domain-containing protein n=1 Tax=Mucilaginibacter conchicola TaxID=2303333 RepID=A0A372NXR6_9SPHI|nr:DUF5074 domain-containing protein [Mucilaginibacter conchicola]RFZ94317.1 DUF5074 domain-containing protein [Mucilaginibacter conchicola]